MFYTAWKREKCPYLEFFWSLFSRMQTEDREIRSTSPYSVLMRENTKQKNSEYRHFLRNDLSHRNIKRISSSNRFHHQFRYKYKLKNESFDWRFFLGMLLTYFMLNGPYSKLWYFYFYFYVTDLLNFLQIK